MRTHPHTGPTLRRSGQTASEAHILTGAVRSGIPIRVAGQVKWPVPLGPLRRLCPCAMTPPRNTICATCAGFPQPPPPSPCHHCGTPQPSAHCDGCGTGQCTQSPPCMEGLEPFINPHDTTWLCPPCRWARSRSYYTHHETSRGTTQRQVRADLTALSSTSLPYPTPTMSTTSDMNRGHKRNRPFIHNRR